MEEKIDRRQFNEGRPERAHVKKTLTLSPEVAEKVAELGSRNGKLSTLVDGLLRQHYKMPERKD